MILTGEHKTTFGNSDQLEINCEWEIELSVTSDPHATGDYWYKEYDIESIKISNVSAGGIEVKKPAKRLIENLEKEIETEVMDNLEIYI